MLGKLYLSGQTHDLGSCDHDSYSAVLEKSLYCACSRLLLPYTNFKKDTELVLSNKSIGVDRKTFFSTGANITRIRYVWEVISGGSRIFKRGGIK